MLSLLEQEIPGSIHRDNFSLGDFFFRIGNFGCSIGWRHNRILS
jgi:hypothetical protein